MSRATSDFYSDTVTYMACETCGPAVAYGDLSGISPEDEDSVVATIEAVGMVTYVDEVRPSGYYTCYFCNTACIGSGNLFEGEVRA